MTTAWEMIKARVARFNATGPVIPDRIGTQRYMPYLLAQSGVPVGIAPNGTIATNGAVTLGTALHTTYSGGIWLRFPANAVVGDSTGGIYWCVMSSTTAGTVYAGKIDAASAFTPYVGSTAGGAVTGSNSAYTQTTAADITLANITVPAGAMGANGTLEIKQATWTNNNSAGTKTPKIKIDSTDIIYAIIGTPNTTLTAGRQVGYFTNRGVSNRNVFNPYMAFGATNATVNSTIDTSVDKSLIFTARLATATDFLILEGFTVEILPS